MPQPTDTHSNWALRNSGRARIERQRTRSDRRHV